MERINQYNFYELGRWLKALAQLEGDMKPNAVMWDLFRVMSVLGELIEGKPIPLGVSLSAARALRAHVASIDAEHFRSTDTDGKPVFKWPDDDSPLIPAWRWDHYRNLLNTFETIFSAEMLETATYFVPRRGIYWTPALVDTADESFPPASRAQIPDKARTEWKAAGRCLAFHLSSSSGFHVARAVEAMMEAYYQYFSGKPDVTLRSWHDYVKELTELAKGDGTPKPTEKTVTELDQMKDDYRNPLMHPRIVLNETESRILFDNGESLILAMAEELRVAKESHPVAQPELTVVGGTSA